MTRKAGTRGRVAYALTKADEARITALIKQAFG